jgi:hypothetical protein
MTSLKRTIICISLLFAVSAVASAQSKPRKPVAKKPVKVIKKPTAVATTESETEAAAAKKNERPVVDDTAGKTNKREGVAAAPQTSAKPLVPTHSYYFTQPEFVVSSITIEHDDTGRGKISFMKKDFDEPISDPIQISPAALERINAALKALNFFDSNESYQYEKDYSHLGNIKIHIKKDGRERTVTFNWTQNKDAKVLADEYRKIGNQATWIFDITVARENQPLNAPQMLDTLDSYIRRGEISDLDQMLPLLQGLSLDERIPLIARNHASRLVKAIEKTKGDKK